jgi:hypothetical protein
MALSKYLRPIRIPGAKMNILRPHHQTQLKWREHQCQIVASAMNPSTRVDILQVRDKLVTYREQQMTLVNPLVRRSEEVCSTF